MEQGKVPTTPTTASIVAAIQCQEAVKLLHGLEVISAQGYVFEGLHHQSYLVNYQRKDDCPAHDLYEPIVALESSVNSTTAGEFLELVRSELGSTAVVELNNDVLSSLACAKCGESEAIFASLGKVTERRGRCPKCGEPRTPQTFHTLDGSEPFLDRTLGELGVPPWDILAGRRGFEQRYYEFAGDRASVLGPVDEAPLPATTGLST